MTRPLVAAIVATVALAAAAPAQAAPCREDRACWLWPVMGDHTRGGVALAATDPIPCPEETL